MHLPSRDIFSLPAKFLPLLDTGLVTTDKEAVIVIQVFIHNIIVVPFLSQGCTNLLPPATNYHYPTSTTTSPLLTQHQRTTDRHPISSNTTPHFSLGKSRPLPMVSAPSDGRGSSLALSLCLLSR